MTSLDLALGALDRGVEVERGVRRRRLESAVSAATLTRLIEVGGAHCLIEFARAV